MAFSYAQACVEELKKDIDRETLASAAEPFRRGLCTGPSRSDNAAVDEQVWTFARNGQALEIRRRQSEDGYLLGVSGDGPVRSYFFADLDRLAAFQADFEKFLLGTGWTFLGYSPERRAGHERRHFSRLISDRRRWWTDGTRPIGHPNSDDYDRRSRSRRRHPR